MASSPSSSHSTDPSYSSRSWNYDVFLSFRGEDTRKTFVDHLYFALKTSLIRTYKDDITLSRGESVGPALLKAIEESHFAVIIFSKNYADSSWCLDELVHIMKCRAEKGQIVMPVFYDVDPWEVKYQKGDFGNAFAKREAGNTTKAESWRKALVDASNNSGWVPKSIANGHESVAIKKIVDEILGKLIPLNLDIDEEFVGMRDRSQDLISILEKGKGGGARMVGIWGVGGSGKTTLATSVYMKMSHCFGSHCIVANIREESSKHGLKTLQEKLISTLLKIQVRVQNEEEGKLIIKTRLCHSNVLILLDDVDDRKQLEALAGSHEWFGKESRIIITTRDKHLLTAHKVDDVSTIKLLSDDEAIRLFKRHAYNAEEPLNIYEKLSLQVVSYASGLPLALKILGYFLYGKNEKEWISTLVRLKNIPESEIVEKLKISYDGLKPVEKEMFLDIACFFRGERKNDAMEIFEACDFHPDIGITVLIQKALITIDSEGKFDMHDLIQEMGHYIVRGEHPNNPEKHSRVWKYEEINNMCLGDAAKENDKIEAIRYDISDPSLHLCNIVSNMKKLRWIRVDKKCWVYDEGPNDYDNSSSFYKITSKMKKLRLLKVDEGNNSLSNQLRYIDWNNPASLFQDSFQPVNLVVLKLSNSWQKKLWKSYKRLPQLKVLKLNYMKKLVSTPDFNGLPCLQELEFHSCKNLKEIHPSLGHHEILKYVTFSDCCKLRMFPTIVQMEKLEALKIGGCHESLEFPEIQENMESLVKLSLHGIGIQVLLSLIGEHCTSLISLNLVYCFVGKSIEVNFDGLKNVKELQFCGFMQPTKTPPKLLGFHQFTCNLGKLDLRLGCFKDGEIPSDIGEMSNLQELNLSGNDFSKLHFSLLQLTRLKLLKLSNCRKLVELPELPSSLAVLEADNCISLTTIGDIYRNCKWLCQVSLMEGTNVNDGDRLLQSMLEGKAIENHTMLLQLQGIEIPKRFIPSLRSGKRCKLQLPENWYNDFCGFLMCAVGLSIFSPWIIMKQVKGGSMGMDTKQDDMVWEESDDDVDSQHHDVVWKESVRDTGTWVWYVSFGSLGHTQWWNQRYSNILFSSADWNKPCCGFGVRLVPRISGGDPTETSTVSSSKSSDEKDDYSTNIVVGFDSKDSLTICPIRKFRDSDVSELSSERVINGPYNIYAI